MTKSDQLARAMIRKYEANVEFEDVRTHEKKVGFDWDKMAAICEEEGVTLDDFLDYGVVIAEGVKNALGSNRRG